MSSQGKCARERKKNTNTLTHLLYLHYYGQKRLPIPEMCEYSLLILHKAPDTDPHQIYR